ncbi:MAG: hypothetical protein HYV24_05405 [Deltaproteobacteria bacterium]|nr:hypothetical protein [Deltaproteobacteria bacterium]
MPNRFVLILCFFFLFVSVTTAEDEIKYPPYPDVWGYELPWPAPDDRRSGIELAKMPNGDFFISHVIKRIQQKRGDSTCCNYLNDFAGLYFFSGKKAVFTQNYDYNEFWKKNHERREGKDKLVFNDGSKIERISVASSAKCPNPFDDFYIIRRDKNGNIIKEKMLLYLYEKPVKTNINQYCERNTEYTKDYIYKKVDNAYAKFALFEDDTFLLYDTAGEFIIRFDKDLSTKSSLLNNMVFLIDRADYIKIVNKLGVVDDQTIDNALAKYLIELKK